jgi:hypothetical protein
VCDLETSKEEGKSPIKGCEYKPTMGCDVDRKKEKKSTDKRAVIQWIMERYNVKI